MLMLTHSVYWDSSTLHVVMQNEHTDTQTDTPIVISAHYCYTHSSLFSASYYEAQLGHSDQEDKLEYVLKSNEQCFFLDTRMYTCMHTHMQANVLMSCLCFLMKSNFIVSKRT